MTKDIVYLEAEMGHLKTIREASQDRKNNPKFEIGDEVGLYFGGGTLIGYVSEIGEGGEIHCRNKHKDGNGFSSNMLPELGGLFHLDKSKYVFTTEDGVKLYQGDLFYWAHENKNYSHISEHFAMSSNSTPCYYQFASKENAKIYIDKWDSDMRKYKEQKEKYDNTHSLFKPFLKQPVKPLTKHEQYLKSINK